MKIDLPVQLRALMGAIGIVLIVSLSVVAINYGNGEFAGGYPITAEFDVASQGIYPGTDVKVRGLNVGKIESIRLNEDNHAVIELDIDDGVKVPRSVAATIEPLSIFGPKFINLIPGEDELTGPYFREDEDAVITNTKPPVEFTLVLGAATELLKRINPRELTTIIHTIAEGIGGLGENIGRTLDSTTTLVGVAKEHEPELRQLLADLALVSQTLGAHGDEVLAGADALHAVLPAVNARADEVGSLLEEISRTSNALTGILDANREVIDPSLIGLSKVADLLNRRQDDVIELVRTLDIFFGSLADVIRLPNEPTSPLMAALTTSLPNDLCQLVAAIPCQSAASAPSVAVAAPEVGDAVTADQVRATLELVLKVLPTSDGGILAPILGGRW
jgi:phospholipid/cholesterol/gamma-HCH transport system substrate-binding protein